MRKFTFVLTSMNESILYNITQQSNSRNQTVDDDDDDDDDHNL